MPTYGRLRLSPASLGQLDQEAAEGGSTARVGCAVGSWWLGSADGSESGWQGSERETPASGLSCAREAARGRRAAPGPGHQADTRCQGLWLRVRAVIAGHGSYRG